MKTILKLSRAIIVLRGTKKDIKLAKEFGLDADSKVRDIMQDRVWQNREFEKNGGFADPEEVRWPQIIIFPEGAITNH